MHDLPNRFKQTVEKSSYLIHPYLIATKTEGMFDQRNKERFRNTFQVPLAFSGNL